MSIQKIVIRQYSVDQHHPQPLLEVHQPSKNRFAEFAGGATAECAVVCCCIPLSLVNLFVLAVYGVPAGLFRKALRRKRRRKLLKKRLLADELDGDLSSHDRSSYSYDGSELLICPTVRYGSYDGSEMLICPTVRYGAAEVLIRSPEAEGFAMKPMEFDNDAIEFENSMWEKFYGTGFWRSGSQRVD
ncbi:hypothetical protein SSX86_023574 [Deinandra increscens subsp. villosa]|uniref:Uncharacterized protein n=1 Tax=Deinandra increscens subsp. villosa TaxID=3103831 RepID=A0AAP0CRA7_9ASTR